MGHLDRGVPRHRRDLRRGHPENGSTFEVGGERRRRGWVDLRPDDGREQPGKPDEREPTHLGQRRIAQTDGDGRVVPRRARQPKYLLRARIAIQAQTHAILSVTVRHESHGACPVIGHRQADRITVAPPERVEGLARQPLDRRHEDRGLTARHRSGSRRKPVARVEGRRGHALLRAYWCRVSEESTVSSPIGEQTAWDLLRALPPSVRGNPTRGSRAP